MECGLRQGITTNLPVYNGNIQLESFGVTASPSSRIWRLGNDNPILEICYIIQDILDYKGGGPQVVH